MKWISRTNFFSYKQEATKKKTWEKEKKGMKKKTRKKVFPNKQERKQINFSRNIIVSKYQIL